MRRSLILILACIFVFAMVTAAWAGGYRTLRSGESPHGGYNTTTDYCEMCHAVHRAKGDFRLTKYNTTYEACNACHGSGGAASTKPVKMENTAASVQAAIGDGGHTAGYSNVAPDDAWDTSYTPAGVDGFGCTDCHSVHNNPSITVTGIYEPDAGNYAGRGAGGNVSDMMSGSTQLISPGEIAGQYEGNKLLLGDPNGLNDWGWCGTTVDLTDWCSDCHAGNVGRHDVNPTNTVAIDPTGGSISIATSTYRHDSQTNGMIAGQSYYDTCDSYGSPSLINNSMPKVDPDDATNNGPTCRQCHIATGTVGVSSWPHQTDVPYMVKTGGISTGDELALDTVCLDCHMYSSSGYALP